jgi:hypothetical protein
MLAEKVGKDLHAVTAFLESDRLPTGAVALGGQRLKADQACSDVANALLRAACSHRHGLEWTSRSELRRCSHGPRRALGKCLRNCRSGFFTYHDDDVDRGSCRSQLDGEPAERLTRRTALGQPHCAHDAPLEAASHRVVFG